MVLYVTEQGAELRKRRRRIVCHKGSTLLESVRVEDLTEVVLFGNVHVTHQALRLLLEGDVQLTLLTLGGRFLGRLVGPTGGHGELRHRQHLALSDPDQALALARGFIRGKLHNQRRLLLRSQRERPQEEVGRALVQMRQMQDRIQGAKDLDQLRGYEGQAAAVYFGVFGALLRAEGVSFTRRLRRPPPDPVNILLSLGYTQLTNLMRSAVELASLDPHLGALHQLRRGCPSLALDLVEEWRPVMVDSLVLELFNSQSVVASDFREAGPEEGTGRPMVIAPAATKRWFARFAGRLNQRVRYPATGQRLRYRQILREQVYAVARHLKGEGSYEPFLASR